MSATAVEWETDEQAEWAQEFATAYSFSINDVLDGAEGFRERQKAHVQNRDAREQELATARREAVLALKAHESVLEDAYTRLLEVVDDFVQVLGSSTAKREEYDALWRTAHDLIGNEVPRKIPSIGERAAASTDEGLVLRRLLTDLRAAKATDLP